MSLHFLAPCAVAALGLTLEVTGCASAASTTAGGTASARRTADVASTPAAAAIGFDQSVRHGIGHRIRFTCIPGRTLTWVGTVVTGHPTATVVPAGVRWVVTLIYPTDELNRPRYQVRKLDGGYCVSRILGEVSPTTSPSPPAVVTRSARS